MFCFLEISWQFTKPRKGTTGPRQILTPPLAVIEGDWHFYATPLDPILPDSIAYGVTWTGAKGRFNVDQVKLELWSDERSVRSVSLRTTSNQVAGRWPPADDGRMEGVFETTGQEAFTLKFSISWPEASPRLLLPVGKVLEAVERSTTLLDEMHSNNLALVFRRRTLWTNSKALAEASPYFRHLLDSGFEEGITRTVDDEMAGARARDVHAELDFDDSDDESAGDTATQSGSPSSSIPPTTCPFPIHKVSITSASYTTYRALLCWLYTSHIIFAPLLSTFRSTQRPDAVRDVRLSAVKALIKENSDLPLPPSPKSIYRLADLLELPELKKLALAAIESQISVNNVAYELFGDVSGCYAEVREMELEFAAKHWAEVKGGAAMREVQQLIEADELPYAVSVWAELAMRL